MAKKQFKAESKRLLDLMINSIYTHKEIFLRELISNASDAIDKLCYISLTDDNVGLTQDDFRITIEADKETRTIKVTDNGIGMTAEELEENLGIIAKSGSLQFKKDMENAEDVDIIGQFGVGFYSAFMVAEKVTVISRAYGEESANCWVSSGADGYTISPCDKDCIGTEIIMEIKPDTDEESYGEFLEEHTIFNIIKKYSDYIRWPIVMDVTKSRQVEKPSEDDSEKEEKTWEDYTESEVINSRVPIWQRPKSEVSDEDCASFYKEKFFDFEDPVAVIRINAEGAVSYRAMLFIPAQAPHDFYTRDFQSGLQLYASGVMIMENCASLLPDHFRFVRGIVDSQDLSLNISREMLQHDRQLKIIATNLEKKIKAELKKLMENDAEKYSQFYQSFGLQLKYGILNSYGANRELLEDIIMFYSSKAEKLVSLKEYVDGMPDGQDYIYYACGDSISKLDKLPQAEPLREKGYEILYLTDDMDEFVVKMLGTYSEKQFCSVNAETLGLESDEQKQETAQQETDNRELLDFIKDSLAEQVAAVKLSHKLLSHPVCLTTQGSISIEMERYFSNIPNESAPMMRAERVLELNPKHEVFIGLKEAYETDKDKAAKYAELLYSQALLIAGLPIDDPSRFSELICELMV